MSDRTCSIDGCSKLPRTRGWCQAHYVRWYRHGDPLTITRKPTTAVSTKRCSTDGCDRPHSARGLCTRHYNQYQASPEFVPVQRGRPACSVAGCDQKAWCRSWCATHYARWRKYGDVAAHVPIGYHEPSTRQCGFDDCDAPYFANGLCQTHQLRLRRGLAPKDPDERAELVEYLNIIKRDPCVYCGVPMSDVDHIVPVVKGGRLTVDNVAPTCRRCNTSKRTRDVLTFMLVRCERAARDVRVGAGVAA